MEQGGMAQRSHVIGIQEIALDQREDSVLSGAWVSSLRRVIRKTFRSASISLTVTVEPSAMRSQGVPVPTLPP